MRTQARSGAVALRLSLLALAAVAAGGCGDGGAAGTRDLPYPPGSKPALRVAGPLSPRIANYTISASLDDKAHRITATSTLRWKHTGKEPVSKVPLHLYMNGFKNETTVFMRESGGKHRGERGGKDAWGWIDVPSIKLAGEELRQRATFGEDETTLWVPLAAPIEPGAELVLDFSFTVQLPEVFARTGYKGDFTMVGQWFPKIGVLEAGPDGRDAWYCHTFHLNSEFYADFGTYDVTLDVPAALTVAATGVLMAAETKGERKTLVYRAEDVHDFAWMTDPRMEWSHTKSELGVDVYVYSRPEQRAFRPRHLEAGKRTIDTFSRLFSPYPWTTMTIISPPPDADGSAGGMEYPTLVTTSGDRWFTSSGVHLPEFVTVHEVGHNWFQGLLASNEAEEAWLDEGINEYADTIVMNDWFGARSSVLEVIGFGLGWDVLHQLGSPLRADAAPIATRSWAFPTNGHYGSSSYSKTAVAMQTLENAVGRERFHAALGAYAKAWAFKHPRRQDLVASLSAALGEDVSWFMDPAFLGRGGADFQIMEVRTRKKHEARGVFGEGETRKTVGEKDAPDGKTFVNEITVANTGTVPAPIDVVFHFADGKRETRRWDGKGTFVTYVLEGAEVETVELDPERRVPIEATPLDNGWTTSGGASTRAAARVSFWEQTLLQIVGF
jgi:hypothetical protein